MGFTLINTTLYAQSCGFGCLGFSGFFAGYTHQSYEATGLNNYLIESFAENTSGNLPKFEAGTGFRVGANFFRAQFDDFFFSAKGYYQFLDEKHEFSIERITDADRYIYNLQSDYFGIGVDFGIPLFHFMDWKIIEGGINIYRTEVNIETFYLNDKVIDVEFENADSDVGYYLASGVIVHILKDYVSIEGTASYSFFDGGNVEDKDQNLQFVQTDKNLIDKSGFAASVQLNLGFPL
jgi:hypothetical protein